MSGFTVNTVTVSGNLTRDPEVRSLPSGTSVCSLRLAVNERYKDNATGEWGDRPNYFNVTVWKGIGEWIGRELRKGDAIVVSGRLRWREWQDNNGGTRQDVDIVAESVVPVPRDGRSSGGGGGGGGQQQQPAGTPPFSAGPPPGADDDIPFLWEPVALDFEPFHAHPNRDDLHRTARA